VRDTPSETLQTQVAAIRRVSPVDRLRDAFELSEAMRELALAGLRTRHPGCSDRELVERLLGHALVHSRTPPRGL